MAIGENSKYNQERAKIILDNVRLGVPIRRVASLAGIDKNTFYNWLAYSDPDDPKYSPGHPAAKDGFIQRVLKAEGECMQRHIAHLETASQKGDAKCSMFLLERKFPDDFGRVEHRKTEISGPGGKPVDNKIIIEYVRPPGKQDDDA